MTDPIPRSERALSEHLGLRLTAFTALYAAQGLPYGLLAVAVPAYMAERGFSAAAIGSFIGITLLPWSLKLLNGPVMDRWSFLPMGRRRPWVLLAQAGMVLCSLAIALLPSPLDHLGWLTAVAFAINFFTAFQDVAVDGMAIEIIPLHEQARANGFMWGGKTVGIAIATAGGAWMMDAYGVETAFLAHAALIGLVMLVPIFARERPGERLLPWTAGQASETARHLQLAGWHDIGRSLLRVFILPASLVGASAIFVHNLLRGLLNAALPVMAVQELGWSDTGYSELSATANLIAGVIGMAAGGALIDRLGHRRSIIAGAFVLATASVAMALAPALWPVRATMYGYVSAYVVLDTLITIAFFAVLMAACWNRVGATQFSLYMAIANMGLSGGSALLGPLRQWFGYSGLLFVAAAWSLIVAALLLFLDAERHRHRVKGLDVLDVSRHAAPVLT